jgi:glycosyltransferase involved in cell wall biosynthesis
MNSLVSIIIPTYNRSKDLKRALQSVFDQTFTNWEVLIVDNHSVDDTDKLVKSFSDPRIKLFKIHNEGVIAASRNLGLKHALGEYIAFLDSDDWWSPKKLEESIKCMHQGADVVYHDLFVVTKLDQRFNWRRTWGRQLKSPVFDDLVEKGPTLPNSSVVVRKKILNKVNGLSEDKNMVGIEDYDAWLRIAQLSDKFQRISKVLGFYWAGGGNISNPVRTLKTYKALEKLYSKTTSGLDVQSRFNWLNYSRGRAYFCLKDFKNAKKHLILNVWNWISYMVFIKTFYMLIWIQLSPAPKKILVRTDKPIKIGLIKNNKSFSPEIEGYLDFFKSISQVQTVVYSDFKKADENSDIVFIFFGFIPFWVKHKSLVIAEYASLSVGRFSLLKNILKRLLNIRGEYYIFLNEDVRKNLFFSSRVPHSLRGMGFVEGNYEQSSNVKKEYDFVYCGSVDRSGVIEAILKIESLGFRIAVVGNSEEVGEVLCNMSKNICCFGKTSLKRSYEIMASARYGLNFTPDIFPYNIQDSTKVIEYCALGLDVVTNRYKWVDEFEERIGAKFLSFEALDSYESVSNFNFQRGDIKNYSWDKVIPKTELMCFIGGVTSGELRSQMQKFMEFPFPEEEGS